MIIILLSSSFAQLFYHDMTVESRGILVPPKKAAYWIKFFKVSKLT